MFVISAAQVESGKDEIYIKTLDVNSYTEFRSTKYTINSTFIEENEIRYFYFAHCSEDIIYVFYQISPNDLNPTNNYMLVVYR